MNAPHAADMSRWLVCVFLPRLKTNVYGYLGRKLKGEGDTWVYCSTCGCFPGLLLVCALTGAGTHGARGFLPCVLFLSCLLTCPPRMRGTAHCQSSTWRLAGLRPRSRRNCSRPSPPLPTLPRHLLLVWRAGGSVTDGDVSQRKGMWLRHTCHPCL